MDTVAELDTAVELAGQALSVIGAVASVYLAAGIVVAFVEGQIASMAGQPNVRADVMYRISLLAACVAVVAFAAPIARDVAGILEGIGADADAVRAAILDLGQYCASILIGLTVVVMAVGVALGFVDTQLNAVLGQPVGLSVALHRVAAVALLGIGGMMGMAIARIVVSALR
jgi:hypothetical protein